MESLLIEGHKGFRIGKEMSNQIGALAQGENLSHMII